MSTRDCRKKSERKNCYKGHYCDNWENLYTSYVLNS